MARRRLTRWLVLAAPAMFAIVAAVLYAFDAAQRAAMERPLLAPAAAETTFDLPRGATLADMAAELHRRGWLEQPLFLVWEGHRLDVSRRLKAGEYQVRAGMTARQLLQDIVAGHVLQHSITLVEGWTFRQALNVLARQPALEQVIRGRSDADIMASLGKPGESPEGRFFPDTYRYTRGTTDLEVLHRAYAAMERTLAELWPGRAANIPLRSPYEALILASIVEKETGAPAERATIAGVFVRRLALGMRLQTDPTVIYGLGPRFDGDLRKVDLELDTPYNTYRRAGLPPTPIALPGRAAIEAALHPAEGEALYFVARGDGTHVFSATLAEHNEAVSRYQLGRAVAPARGAGEGVPQ